MAHGGGGNKEKKAKKSVSFFDEKLSSTATTQEGIERNKAEVSSFGVLTGNIDKFLKVKNIAKVMKELEEVIDSGDPAKVEAFVKGLNERYTSFSNGYKELAAKAKLLKDMDKADLSDEIATLTEDVVDIDSFYEQWRKFMDDVSPKIEKFAATNNADTAYIETLMRSMNKAVLITSNQKLIEKKVAEAGSSHQSTPSG